MKFNNRLRSSILVRVVLLAFILVFSLGSQVAADASTPTISDVVYGVVEYYENETLSHWEELVALDLSGEDLTQWTNIGNWDENELDESSSATAYAGRILGLLALGENPADYNDRNLIDILKNKQQSNGSFGGTINNTIWAIIALEEATTDYDNEKAAEYLISQQKENGGFVLFGELEDPDTTGDALLALSKCMGIDGVNTAADKAVEYLQNIQLESAGFESVFEWDSQIFRTENSQSTAKAITGLLAADENLLDDVWLKDNKTMIDALLDYQVADKSFKYSADGTSNKMATRQVLKALADLKNAGYGEYIYASVIEADYESENATVRVRVEGYTESLADEVVTLSGTAFDALEVAVGSENIEAPGGFITSIKGETAGTFDTDPPSLYDGWLFLINGNLASVGADAYNVNDGDELVFYYGVWPGEEGTLIPSVTLDPFEAEPNEEITVTVESSYYDWGLSQTVNVKISEAKVVFNGKTYTTDSEGMAVLQGLSSSGAYYLKVSKDIEGSYPRIVRTDEIPVLVKSSGSGSPAISDEVDVYVDIVGKYNIHFSDWITLSKSKANAFEALKATGISYKAWEGGAYVYEIAGEREDLSGTAGWKYKVNSTIPGDSAIGYSLKDGDNLLWFWADDYTATEPTRKTEEVEDENEIFTQLKNAISVAITKLKEISQGGLLIKNLPVEINNLPNKVIGIDKPMTEEQKGKLAKLLIDNVVFIAQTIRQGMESNLSDKQYEISLEIGINALDQDIVISVVEKKAYEDVKFPQTHKALSSIYEFGPNGTSFYNPVYLSIRVVIPDGINYEDIVLAWYDSAKEQWFAVPTVIDVSTGTITGLVEHFTKFAVLVRDKQPTQFFDVDKVKYSWAEKEINYLALHGIVQGMGDGRFEPAREVNRAEFTAMFVRALGLDATVEYQGIFDDVHKDSWYAGYLQAAADAGIIKGLTENTFAPTERIKREQLAVMISRVLDGQGVEQEALKYKDADQIAAWAKHEISQVVSKNIFNGFPDGTFRPKETVNRAQSAAVIYRFLVEQ